MNKVYLTAAIAALSVACLSEEEARENELLDQSDEEVQVEVQEEEIINGSTNFAGKEFERNRVVQIRTPQGGLCSGTLLLPNVVMTARHCVTVDGSIGGALAAPASIRARIRSAPVAPVAPPGVDACAGAGRDPTCAAASLISQISASVDMVFLRLAAPLSWNGDTAMFTPLELQAGWTANEPYVGANLTAMGWGRNTCDGGSGTLRWGTVKVTSVKGGTDYTMLIAPVGNQGVWRGDSGGPTWGTRTFPPAALSVHSLGNCTTLADGSSQAKTGTDVQVARHFNDVRNKFALATTLSDYTEGLGNLGVLDIVNIASDSAPDWRIVNGKLTQKANSNASVVLVRDEIVQRVLGGAYSVTVSSSDDDTTGVVLSYVDAKNFLSCEVDEQNARMQLVATRNGSRSVLASTSWAGDYAKSVTVTADVIPSWGGTWSFPITCKVSGGGVAAKSIKAYYSDLPAGRVGIYNRYLDEATYSNFVVNSVM